MHNQPVNVPLPQLLTSHSSRLRLACLYLVDEQALLVNFQSNQYSVLRVVNMVPVTAVSSPSAPPTLLQLSFSFSFILLLLLIIIINFIIIIIIIIRE